MSISAYIKSNEQLKNMDFATVYCVIIELIADNRLKWNFEDDKNVPILQPEPLS